MNKDNFNSKDYIIALLNKGNRIDGRKLDQYRDIKIETLVSNNADGSARVKIGKTEVIAGIKLAVGEPYPDNPDEGSIIVTAEFLPLASPEFESGPPGIQSIELARVVDRGIRESKAIDFKKLCIIQGEKAWLVFIDIYTINDAGNLQDAALLASIIALKNTKYPKLKEDNTIDYKAELTKEELPLQDEPIECTVYKIGDKLLVDVITEEEIAVDSRLTVAINKKGRVCALQKGNDKGITIEELEKIMDLAIKKTKEIRKLL